MVGKVARDATLARTNRMADIQTDGHGHEYGHGPIEKPSLQAHVRTYDGVIALFKWGTIVSVVIAALVIWLIAT